MNPITINGYDTYYQDIQHPDAPCLIIAIPKNADIDISKICGTMVCGHFIKKVSYQVVDDTRFIMAYY